MKEDELIRSAAAAVAAEAMLQPEQIPAIDLYMDQVITVLEQGIGRSGREADERPMTKAMINNYTKGGVIRPVKGKKYSKEQIIQLLLVYYLKGTLSLQDIKGLISGLSACGGEKAAQRAYLAQLRCRSAAAELAPQAAVEIAAKAGGGPDARTCAIFACAATAELMRRTAQALIDGAEAERREK